MPPHFLSILILFITVQTHSLDDNIPYVTYCSGNNFTSPSAYASNLRRLLGGLVASTPNSPSLFSTTNSSSPQIFGLAQCLPDISAAVCAACLNNSAVLAATNTPGGCGQNMAGSFRSSNCLLRYSGQLFFSSVEDNIIAYDSKVQNAPDSFNRQVQVLMKTVMESAASAATRFAVGIANDSVVARDIYGMGWCSMDLASSDCAQCMGMVMGRLPAGKNRGIGGTVSCALRFETFQFFSSSAIVMPSSAPAAAGVMLQDYKVPRHIISKGGPQNITKHAVIITNLDIKVHTFMED